MKNCPFFLMRLNCWTKYYIEKYAFYLYIYILSSRCPISVMTSAYNTAGIVQVIMSKTARYLCYVTTMIAYLRGAFSGIRLFSRTRKGTDLSRERWRIIRDGHTRTFPWKQSTAIINQYYRKIISKLNLFKKLLYY